MCEGCPPRGFSHHTKVSSSLSSADSASTQDDPHTLRINQSSLLTPPAVITRQAEQIANARRRAAEDSLAPYTIPLLANTQTRSSENRVTWTLKFTLPAPAADGTTRWFSAVPRGYGASGAHALEGAVRYVSPPSTTGEDRAEGASFWYAFLTPFWGRKNIFFSKEPMLKPMSDLSQIQDEPSKSLD